MRFVSLVDFACARLLFRADAHSEEVKLRWNPHGLDVRRNEYLLIRTELYGMPLRSVTAYTEAPIYFLDARTEVKTDAVLPGGKFDPARHFVCHRALDEDGVNIFPLHCFETHPCFKFPEFINRAPHARRIYLHLELFFDGALMQARQSRFSSVSL